MSSSSSSSFDFNIDSYTPLELFGILKLDEETATSQEIEDSIEPYIVKYTKDNNQLFIDFFTKMQEKLLDYLDSLDDTHKQQQQPQHPIIDVNAPNTGTNFNVGVKKDSLNPNLKNITSRLIYLDSQYRQSSGTETSTDFTLELSDPLTNLLSLKLYSPENVLGSYQPGIVIDIGGWLSTDSHRTGKMNLLELEKELDERIDLITANLDYEDILWPFSRKERYFDTSTPIYDYTLKILLKM